MKKRSFGFTLLELLVVISIIGILVAVGAASFTTAQKKGRDAKRLGDMKAMQNALEQFYGRDGTYPNGCNNLSDPDIIPGGLPSDPKPGMSYYVSCPGDGTYCACATLEQAGVGNSSAGNNCTSFGSGNYFCVKNLQ